MSQPASSGDVKYRIVFLICCSVILFVFSSACQATGLTTATTAATTTSATTATPEKASTTGSTTSTVAETSSAEPLPFCDNDLIITVEGQTYFLLEDAAGLLQVLGEDFQYSEAESCVYDGLDKTFDYGSLCIYTIPAEETDLLDGIDIYDDSVTTARNITVGSSREDVLQAYGPQVGEESDLVYNTSNDIGRLGDPKLTFIMNGDLVVAISYYSGSNFQD
ncbi:MAG: hypothetical protein GX112_03520 [Clostridiaceae bacterium]|jgi:hypothetical protein|nr:hypothetical protein [Clostridiaceae bacterium]